MSREHSVVESPKPAPRRMSVDRGFVDEAVERIRRRPEAVIPGLQAMQNHYGHLPAEALRRVYAAEVCPSGASMLKGNGCAGCRLA